MVIYPAIDLRRGRCVRLRRGSSATETVLDENPVAVARHWVAQGARWLHVVNLDGAIDRAQSPIVGRPSAVIQRIGSADEVLSTSGLPGNLRSLKQIRQAVSVPIQYCGGLRSLEDVELAFAMGADRVVLGIVTIHEPEMIRTAIERWGAERIVVGLEAKDGLVAFHGTRDGSEVNAVDMAHYMKCLGVRRIIYTDLSDRKPEDEISIESTSSLGDMTDLMVIVNGGVTNLYDVRQLKRHEHYNIEGVIVDDALYTGTLDLAAAIAIGDGPLERHSAGLIPYRRTNHGIEFLLLWNNFCEQWQFPRGTVHEGENLLTCAQREFTLETGLPVSALHEDVQVLLKYVAHIRNYDVERVVTYYLAEVGPGEIVLGHDNHGDYQWVSAREARLMLIDTSPEQLPALEEAIAQLYG